MMMTLRSLAVFLLTILVIQGCGPFDGLSISEIDPGSSTDQVADSSPAGSVSIKGCLAFAEASPAGAEQPAEIVGSVVVAVSSATQRDYRGTVDASGEFAIDIPDDEAGSTFILTILGADGRPVGPVLLAMADGMGLTGLKPAGEVELGTIVLPENPGAAPIVVGADAALGVDDVDPEATARLDGNGVVVGLASFGKGQASLLPGGAAGDGADSDQDGLVDLFDADDDGNGTVDDFEPGAVAWAMPLDSDVRANFFMNLKIAVENSGVYYSGTSGAIDAALAHDTVITFECLTEPFATRSIVGAQLLATPAPAYLPGATLLADGASSPVLWSSVDYAFSWREDRYDAFVVPNAVMQAGDTFTVEIAMSDGSTITASRMLNYIFKRIPRVVNYGSSGSLQSFDPDTPAGNGSLGLPVSFDGTQDLVVEFAPPEDEDGTLLTSLDYKLEFFFYDEDGSPVNGIDVAATWPTPVAGTSAGSTNIDVAAGDLTLTADNTFMVTVPKEMFIDEAVLTGSGTAAVKIYKMDIAAQCPSGNAAIMWALTKQ